MRLETRTELKHFATLDPLAAAERIHELKRELAVAVKALEFYARTNHFEFDGATFSDCEALSEPETVSGEPQNYLCGHGDFTFEDGSIAREALELLT